MPFTQSDGPLIRSWTCCVTLVGLIHSKKKKMEVSSILKKRNSHKVQPVGTKSLSSTYQSFRDSDTSLFSFHADPAEDIVLHDTSVHKFHTLHTVTGLTRSPPRSSPLLSGWSLTELDLPVSSTTIAEDTCFHFDLPEEKEESDEETAPAVNQSREPGRRLLVYNCLKALGHGQWFNHWRKFCVSTTPPHHPSCYVMCGDHYKCVSSALFFFKRDRVVWSLSLLNFNFVFLFWF